MSAKQQTKRSRSVPRRSGRVGSQQGTFFSWPFSTVNYLILLGALAVIVLGYVFLGTGPYDSAQSVTVGPVLLVIGYTLLVPLAILYGVRIGRRESVASRDLSRDEKARLAGQDEAPVAESGD